MNPPLDRIIGLETQREILEVLTPQQLCAIALRLDGLNDVEIAELLGCTKSAVSIRVANARRRLLELYPHLVAAAEGRKRHPSHWSRTDNDH